MVRDVDEQIAYLEGQIAGFDEFEKIFDKYDPIITILNILLGFVIGVFLTSVLTAATYHGVNEIDFSLVQNPKPIQDNDPQSFVAHATSFSSGGSGSCTKPYYDCGNWTACYELVESRVCNYHASNCETWTAIKPEQTRICMCRE